MMAGNMKWGFPLTMFKNIYLLSHVKVGFFTLHSNQK